MPVGPRIGFQAPIFVAPESPATTPAVVVSSASTLLNVYVFSQENRSDHMQRMRVHLAVIAKPSRPGIQAHPPAPLMADNDKRERQVRAAAHQVAYVNRPPWTGVPRAKTIKGILIHRASSVAARGRLKRHSARILRAPLISRAPQVISRSVAKRAVFRTRRKRHEPLILRAILRVRDRASVTTHSQREHRRPFERNRAFIFKAPFVSAVVTTQTTIKYVYTHSVSRLRQQRQRIAKNPAVILRANIIGVRRETTIKSIFVRSVGRQEQIAKHRRHRASVLKTPLRVTTPLGRVLLHPVDTSKSAKVRRARLAFLFRSRGGVAVVISQKTIQAIFVHPVTRSARLEARLRRHRARVSRAPITVTRGRASIHSIDRSQAGKTRRHKLFFFRSTQIGVARTRTTKPIYIRVLRKRHIQRLRRHFPRILRSLGGQALSDVVFIEPFDQPTPTGRSSSVPTHSDYDYPGPLGRTGSSPSEGAFDIPVPIGVTDIPDPEV
jgi:ribosomal protein L19